jgi:hypothetical protein
MSAETTLALDGALLVAKQRLKISGIVLDHTTKQHPKRNRLNHRQQQDRRTPRKTSFGGAPGGGR